MGTVLGSHLSKTASLPGHENILEFFSVEQAPSIKVS